MSDGVRGSEGVKEGVCEEFCKGESKKGREEGRV